MIFNINQKILILENEFLIKKKICPIFNVTNSFSDIKNLFSNIKNSLSILKNALVYQKLIFNIWD